MPTRPKNLYGVSKVFGESLGAYYVYQQNIEVVTIRIGAFQYQHEYSQLSSRDRSAWSEPLDVCSLLINSMETDLNDEPFVIAHGISNNRFKRLDITETKKSLVYEPESELLKFGKRAFRMKVYPSNHPLFQHFLTKVLKAL